MSSSIQQQFMAKLATPVRPKHILVYGPARSGKTTALGSLALDPRTSPHLMLSVEGGEGSLAGIPADKLSVYPITSFSDFNLVFQYLQTSNHPYKSISVDSLSALHTLSLFGIVDASLRDKSRKSDDYEIYQSDYGKAMVQMRRILIALKDLPIHVVYTALTKTELEPKGYVSKPLLYGQLSDEVSGMFDALVYLSQEKAKKDEEYSSGRVLVLQNFPGVRAGIRAPYGVTLPNFLPVGDTGLSPLLDLLGLGEV